MRIPLISSLYGRIFTIFWLTLLAVLIVVVIGPDLDPRARHNIENKSLKNIEHLANDISRKYSSSNDLNDALKKANQHIRKKSHRLDAFFTTTNGDILSRPEKIKGRKKDLLNFLTQSDNPNDPKQKLYGRTMISGPFIINVANTTTHMYITRDWRKPPSLIIRILDHPFHMLLFSMLVSTPLLFWLSWALSQPARRLQKAAERVTQGEFKTDANLEKGPKEFKKTGQSFNQMIGSLNTMISSQQRLLSDISHELRSPLTRLRMATALATRKQGESTELTRIDMEAERLETMISELLELSRIQVNSHLDREKTDAYSLWFDILEDAKFESDNLEKTMIYTGLQATPMFGSINLLMSAIENVIRNAIKYANDLIEVTLHEQNKKLIIHVDDNGDGVPESELNDIFKPFYRTSTARDRSSGGTGLGLSITESAIQQHNGTIVASKSPLGGLRVTIILPVYDI